MCTSDVQFPSILRPGRMKKKNRPSFAELSFASRFTTHSISGQFPLVIVLRPTLEGKCDESGTGQERTITACLLSLTDISSK